jgi:hypothetical protein
METVTSRAALAVGDAAMANPAPSDRTVKGFVPRPLSTTLEN